MESLEIQEAPRSVARHASRGEEPQQFSEVHLKNFPWKACAGVTLACVFLQALYTFRASWFMAQAASDMDHMVQLLSSISSDGDDTDPFAPDAPDDEDDPSSGEGCEGFYSKGVELVGFESYCAGYETDFLTLWTNPGKDSEVYMEFGVSARQFPLRVGVAAVSMNGPMSHFDATAPADYFLEFSLVNVSETEDLSGAAMIEIHQVDLSQRTATTSAGPGPPGEPGRTDDAYSALFDAHGVRTLLARLPVLAIRKTADCSVAAVLVDGSPLLGVGLFALDYPIQMLSAVQWRIELSTVKSFRNNLDFSVDFGGTLVRFCLYKLPTLVMPPRMADDRVGFFVTEFERLGDYRADAGANSRAFKNINPMVRMINRQWPYRSGNPKEHGVIHYYVDPTVPLPFQAATKEGVLLWQPAFAAVGLEIRAHSQQDKDWPENYDVADINFNTISWAAGDGENVFAIGQSIVDPRSGEVLKANIVFTLGWLESWLGAKFMSSVTSDVPMHRATSRAARRLEARDEGVPGFASALAEAGRELGGARILGGGPRRGAAGVRPRRLGEDAGARAGEAAADGAEGSAAPPAPCGQRPRGRSLRHHHPHEGASCRSLHDGSPHLFWELRARSSSEADEFLRAGVRDVTVHEVGHTLGLRHNFRGSYDRTFEQTQDADFVNKHGLTSSVMDYLPVNIAPGRSDDLPYFTPVIGDYDKWAIHYGYMLPPRKVGDPEPQVGDPGGEKRCCEVPAAVADWAALYVNANFTFATDEDADSFDPYTRRFDMTKTPPQWLEGQLQLARQGLQSFTSRLTVYPRESQKQVQEALQRLVRTGTMAAQGLVCFVGGVTVSRSRSEAGCSGADCFQQQVRAASAAELASALRQLFDFLRTFPEVDVASILKIAVVGEGLEDDIDSFLSFQPWDLRRTILQAKARVLGSMLTPSRLARVKLAEDTRETREPPFSDGKPPLDPLGPVVALLQMASRELLGVGEGKWAFEGDQAGSAAFTEEDQDRLRKMIGDPDVQDLQLLYLESLASASSSALGRQPYVTTAVTGEIVRLWDILEKVHGSIMQDAEVTLSGSSAIGFLTEAFRVLGPARGYLQ